MRWCSMSDPAMFLHTPSTASKDEWDLMLRQGLDRADRAAEQLDPSRGYSAHASNLHSGQPLAFGAFRPSPCTCRVWTPPLLVLPHKSTHNTTQLLTQLTHSQPRQPQVAPPSHPSTEHLCNRRRRVYCDPTTRGECTARRRASTSRQSPHRTSRSHQGDARACPETHRSIALRCLYLRPSVRAPCHARCPTPADSCWLGRTIVFDCFFRTRGESCEAASR
jgi:hypothetical protein